MALHGTTREGPVRATFASIGDRWSTLILLVLETGNWRHADLRRTLGELSAEGAISQRVLTLKLRTLERDGFVCRSVSEETPPKVSYWLSPLGTELVSQIRVLLNWITVNEDAIEGARESFDAAD